MKYKDVSITYKDRPHIVQIQTIGNETNEELEIKANEMLDRIYNDVIRKHFGMEE